MANLFWPAALASLPQDSYAYKLLKIHYLQKVQKFNSAPARKPENTRCMKCYSPWSAGDYTLKVIPTVARNHRKNVRRLTKLEATGVEGNRKQEWIKRKLRESTNHQAVLGCNICHKKTKLIMKKSKKATTLQQPIKAPLPVTVKSNRKRKKDAFAGLNADVLNRHKKNKPANSNKPSSIAKQSKNPKKETDPASSKNTMLDLAKFLKTKK